MTSHTDTRFDSPAEDEHREENPHELRDDAVGAEGHTAGFADSSSFGEPALTDGASYEENPASASERAAAEQDPGLPYNENAPAYGERDVTAAYGSESTGIDPHDTELPASPGNGLPAVAAIDSDPDLGRHASTVDNDSLNNNSFGSDSSDSDISDSDVAAGTFDSAAVPASDPEPEPVVATVDGTTGESTAEATTAAATETVEGKPDQSKDRVAELWGTDEVTQYRDEWRDLQLRFVDDPNAATQEAGSLVDKAAEALVNALHEQKRSLDEWRSGQDDTEVMRQAMQHYRSYLDRLLGV